MTRYIWFRGQTINDDKIVYGYYIARENGKEYIFDGSQLPWRCKNIAQFVGIDSEDNDIYEGDVLLDEYGNEHVAAIQDFPKVIASLKLKEAAT